MAKLLYEVLMEEVPAGYYFAGLGNACKGSKYYDKDAGWIDADERMAGAVVLLALPDVTIDAWANAQPLLRDFLRYVKEGEHSVVLYGDGKHILRYGRFDVFFYAEPCPDKFRDKALKVVNGRWAAS